MAKKGKFGGKFGAGSMPGSTNMILKQAAKMQQKMVENKERFAKLLFTGEAGGVLKIIVRGDNKVMSVNLDEDAFVEMDKDDVEDLIKAALTDVFDKIQNAENDAEKALMSGAAQEMTESMSKDEMVEVKELLEQNMTTKK